MSDQTVRAKFRVNTISEPREANRYHDDGSEPTKEQVVDISLYPVTGGSPENKKFYTNTPGGLITLQTTNLEATKLFEQGKEYYVDFTKAD